MRSALLVFTLVNMDSSCSFAVAVSCALLPWSLLPSPIGISGSSRNGSLFLFSFRDVRGGVSGGEDDGEECSGVSVIVVMMPINL